MTAKIHAEEAVFKSAFSRSREKVEVEARPIKCVGDCCFEVAWFQGYLVPGIFMEAQMRV